MLWKVEGECSKTRSPTLGNQGYGRNKKNAGRSRRKAMEADGTDAGIAGDKGSVGRGRRWLRGTPENDRKDKMVVEI